MRGSVSYQVHELFSQSGVNQIGQSKHAAKKEARNQGASTWHQIGRQLGVHSFSTADAYRDVWAQILQYAKQEFGVKDIEKLTGANVSSFLASKVEHGVAYATFQQYAAAAEKLAVALNRYSERLERANSYSFSEAIKEVRSKAREELARFDASRAYENPRAVIAQISKADHQLAACLQLESGARIHEISLIKGPALLGTGQDRFTKQEVGFYKMSGKGGKEGVKAVSIETYRRLEAHVQKHGVFKINEGAYRESLKTAAAETNQSYEGSHGLRWNYAQGRYNTLQEHGLSDVEAELHISKEMGHERGDITRHYLRGRD